MKINIENKINLKVPLKTTDRLDYEVEKFTDVQQAAWRSTPEMRHKLKGNNYPSEIREIIKEKRKVREKVAEI